MSKLKVLFIAGWYPSEDNPIRGIFVKEHAKAVALYNDIVVLHSEGFTPSLSPIYNISDEVEDGIRTLRLRHRQSPIPKTTYFVKLWGMYKAFQKVLKEDFKPDIIHAHVYSAGVPAVLIGKRTGIPVVITEHFSGFPRRTIKGFEQIKANFALKQAKLVMPVSEDLARHIKDYGVENDFRVIPNAVNTDLFYPSREGNQHVAHRLLLVALLNEIKGVPYLLEAVSKLVKQQKDFVLDIVGDGPHREEYENKTFKLGIQDKVNFHGLKTKEEVAKFMRRADFFVLPSEWENLPCVLIEAMASGLPIVATKVGGIPEMITDDVGILVPPANVVELAEAIDYMLDNYSKYNSKQIAEYARNHYSYSAVGKALNQVYHDTISHTDR